MFGYVKPDKAELKIKEFETYKAVYCSLCKALGKEYGLLSRFMLTYDATFYVLFMKSIFQNSSDCAHKGVCRFNPLKKCNYIDEDEILRRAAALTVIMAFYKVSDNLKDGGILKKIASYLLFPYVKAKYLKAKKKYPEYNNIIKVQMERQAQLEAQNCESVDLACDPSAKALSELFAIDMENGEKKELVKRAAYCLGRWVYLMDAFDDLEKDIKHNSYNPFVFVYKLASSNDENIIQVRKQIVDRIRITANEAADSFEKINKSCYGSVLENIVFDGMENELNILIDKKKKRGERVGQ